MREKSRSILVLVAGAASAVLINVYGAGWLTALSGSWWLGGLFIWLFAAMIACAFAAIRHADKVAHTLGEPLGTLLLTISVVGIEVLLISMIMLLGEDAPTLARDTMFATLMIVLNGAVGLALLAGGLRYGQQDFNLEGARAYLAVIMPLAIVPLIVPKFTLSTPDPTLTPFHALAFALFTVALYAVFLGIQTLRHRSFFEQPGDPGAKPIDWADQEKDAEIAHESSGGSTLFDTVMLVLLLIPFITLADELAHFVDYGIVVLGVPAAVGGVMVAAVVLLPETASALKAALADQLQRAVNLCLGAALSTIGLTLPAVLIIGLVTGKDVILGLDDVNAVLLVLTLLLSMLTFGGVRTNVLQGAVHLVLFLVFLVLVIQP